MNRKIKKESGTAYWVKTLIGMALIFGVQFLPAPAPITRTGMAVIGMFLGLIWCIAMVDKVWPTFVIMVLFSFYALDIYPASTQSSPVYETVNQSIGNWITFFIIALMLLCHAVSDSGLLRRLTVWFVTRKAAKKGPWSLTVMFLLATLIVASVMDCTPAAMVMVMISHEIFEALGFKPGDAWPKAVVCMIPMVVTVAFGMTPIGHNLAIGIMGITAEAAGVSINIGKYMLIGVPLGLLILFMMLLYFRFVVKPDVSQFEQVDYERLNALKNGSITKKEKVVMCASLLVLLFWLAPGLLNMVAPESRILAFINRMSMLFPVLVADAVLAVIRIDGEPVLDLKRALNEISWVPTFMFAGIIMIANALRQDSVGVIAWFAENIAPKVMGAAPFAVLVLLAVVTIIATNFLNNNAVGYLLITACAPVAIELGIDPTVIAVVIALGANCAFTTPAASVVATFSCTDEYCDAAHVFRNGCVMLVISILVLALLAYPLSLLIL